MNSSNPRYDIICDPLDMWIVWDNQADEPATFGGQILHGLTQGYAVEVAKIMNEIYGKGGSPAAQVKKDAPADTILRSAN
jgi:hypothetical protein